MMQRSDEGDRTSCGEGIGGLYINGRKVEYRRSAKEGCRAMDSGATLLQPCSAARVRDDVARRHSGQHDCAWQDNACSRRVRREAGRDNDQELGRTNERAAVSASEEETEGD